MSKLSCARALRSLAARLVGLCVVCLGLGAAAAHAQTNEVTVEIGGGAGLVRDPSRLFVCLNTCTRGVPANTPLTLTAVPAEGFGFAGWSGACSGTGSCVLPANTAATIRATFERLPSFILRIDRTGDGTVTSGGRRIRCGDDCAARFLAEDVTLAAAADAGADFVGWGGACTGSAPTCTLSLAADTQVTARFTTTVVTGLSVTSTDGGTLTGTAGGGTNEIECRGGCSASASFAPDTLVTLTATPDEGFSIARWTGACAPGNTGAGGPSQTCEVRVTGSLTAGVEFAADQAIEPPGPGPRPTPPPGSGPGSGSARALLPVLQQLLDD